MYALSGHWKEFAVTPAIVVPDKSSIEYELSGVDKIRFEVMDRADRSKFLEARVVEEFDSRVTSQAVDSIVDVQRSFDKVPFAWMRSAIWDIPNNPTQSISAFAISAIVSVVFVLTIACCIVVMLAAKPIEIASRKAESFLDSARDESSNIWDVRVSAILNSRDKVAGRWLPDMNLAQEYSNVYGGNPQDWAEREYSMRFGNNAP